MKRAILPILLLAPLIAFAQEGAKPVSQLGDGTPILANPGAWRTALSLVPGTHVQGWDEDLATLAGGNGSPLTTGISASAITTGTIPAARLPGWTVVSGAGTDTVGARVQTDTSGGAFARTLPASPSAGDSVEYEDAALTWHTHALTINRNGNLLNSGSTNYTANVIGGKVRCVFVGGSIGWSVK